MGELVVDEVLGDVVAVFISCRERVSGAKRYSTDKTVRPAPFAKLLRLLSCLSQGKLSPVSMILKAAAHQSACPRTCPPPWKCRNTPLEVPFWGCKTRHLISRPASLDGMDVYSP
jgi:hypothetical protein